MYRADLRLSPGQHHIWCQGGESEKYDFSQSCADELEWYWSEKSIPKGDVKNLFPILTQRPRICAFKLGYPMVDHYKYTNGVSKYLQVEIITSKCLP